MAKSGTLGTLSGSYKTTYTVTWSLLSQDPATNTSKIRLTAKFYTGNTTTIASSYSTFKLDGTTVYSGSYSFSGAGTKFTKTKDIEVEHNSDGSFPGRSVSFSTNDYIMGNQSGSGTITGIEDIPRESDVSCTSPNIGDTATITIDKAASSFTHTLTYAFGDLTGTIATKTSKETVSWDTSSLATKLYAEIPSAKKGSGTITCKAYSGSTLVGTSTCSFNLYAVEEDCKPDVSGTVVDTNEATANFGKLVKYLSKPKVTITATPKNSATIKSYSINLNDGQSSTSQEETFSSIGSDSITINAKDSRGYDNPKTLELDMIPYIKLHIDNISIERTEDVSSEVILNANGVWFNGNLNEELVNTLTTSFYYKSSEDTEWIQLETVEPTIDGNTFAFNNISLGNTYEYTNEYRFKIVLSDVLMTVGNTDKEAITVPKGIAVVEIGDDLVNINGLLTLNDEDFISKIYEYIDTNTRRLNNYTELEDGTDLNTITKQGTYRSTSSAHTATMTNIPNGVSGGFTMYVTGYTSIPTNGSYRRQEIICSCETYIRRTSNGGSTWTNWYKVVLEDA
ncbi:MAG: hypothetical protein IKL65_00305 [Bacilli bacterium]|nr:hypothetical protein [Bacilli bacterium]